jgi:hypothetical protein
MTKTLIATATLLIAVSAHAADSREQFISGNPDSDNKRAFYEDVTAMPRSVGTDRDRYQGIAEGNADLFDVDLGADPGASGSHARPDIYGPFGASPDLSY